MTQPLTTQTSVNAGRPSSTAVLVTAAAGITAIAMAVYQVATPGAPSADFDSVLDWAREALFLLYLGTSMAAITVARRTGLAPRAAHLLITLGYGAIAAGVIAGMIARDDPEWFFVVGGPGNLAAAIGFVIFAVHLRRRVRFPLWVAVLCGVGGVLAVLMSELGTSVLIGAFWLFFAVRLGNLAAESDAAR